MDASQTYLPGYHFRVDILPVPTTNPVGLAITSAAYATMIANAALDVSFIANDYRFQSASGLSYQLETRDVREGGQIGNPHKLFEKVTFPELVLSRGMVLAASPVTANFHVAMQSLQSLKLTILVTMLHIVEKVDVPVRAWLLTGALPSHWEVATLDAQANTLAVETLSFSYENMRTLPL